MSSNMPSIFTLADVADYVALLAHIGPVALALTTNLNINFLNRAEAVPLDGVCKILKLGRTLAMLEIAVERASRMAFACAAYAFNCSFEIPNSSPNITADTNAS